MGEDKGSRSSHREAEESEGSLKVVVVVGENRDCSRRNRHHWCVYLVAAEVDSLVQVPVEQGRMSEKESRIEARARARTR